MVQEGNVTNRRVYTEKTSKLHVYCIYETTAKKLYSVLHN
jgi:hypothetical protein